MDEEFERYLRQLGTLYWQGVVSREFSPDHLRRMGGVLALAGNDAEWIREERNQDQIRVAARRRWQEHEQRIVASVQSGIAPARAVERHVLSRTQTYPQSPSQAAILIQLSLWEGGRSWEWQIEFHKLRRLAARAGEITDSPVMMIGAGVHNLVTSADWDANTPQSWQSSVEFGASLAPIEGMVTAIAAPLQSRGTHPQATTPDTRVEIARGTAPSDRGNLRPASGATLSSSTAPAADLRSTRAITPVNAGVASAASRHEPVRMRPPPPPSRRGDPPAGGGTGSSGTTAGRGSREPRRLSGTVHGSRELSPGEIRNSEAMARRHGEVINLAATARSSTSPRPPPSARRCCALAFRTSAAPKASARAPAK